MTASSHDLDPAQAITHVSLCSGYGGIDLGLRRCLPNLRTVAYAEIEAFACELLLSRMEGGQLDAAPIWTDLKSFPWGKFHGCVDILSGGYPCQPFSAAGKRLGKDDPRHLWPSIADGVSRMQPRVVFFENVEGHISLGLREVIADLESRGYQTTWGLFSAAECGAPHSRKRVFILAHRKGSRLERYGQHAGKPENAGLGSGGQVWPSRPGQPQFAWEPPRVVANSNGQRCDRQPIPVCERRPYEACSEAAGGGAGVGDAECSEWRPLNNGISVQADKDSGAASASDWRQTKPSLGRNADGRSHWLDYAELCQACDNRTDELRLLGNGVVPATAELAFKTLAHELRRNGL